jgi:Flp pilus assembly pilin Flp
VNPHPAKPPVPIASALESSAGASTDLQPNKRQPNIDAPATNLWALLKQVHRDERGAVSIETILIIAAIALPILIFIIKFGWPRIRKFFNEGMDELEGGALDAAGE